MLDRLWQVDVKEGEEPLACAAEPNASPSERARSLVQSAVHGAYIQHWHGVEKLLPATARHLLGREKFLRHAVPNSEHSCDPQTGKPGEHSLMLD